MVMWLGIRNFAANTSSGYPIETKASAGAAGVPGSRWKSNRPFIVD
jgi:hypothetical protein